ncbi:helix-turn-helix transcriptional regulator [Lysobacter antibioticus]|uniref:helix-turn-helix transcriptional regulator n=1 Tax=Lysobacter antibioticus TaxID=84531 RepID=UPI0003483B1E|nr:helix-turn-helix domain-containing protein [Lysobacter antibioticus]
MSAADRLNVRAAARYLGIAKSTLDKMRSDGRGPRYLRLGTRVFYRPKDLDEYVASKFIETTDSRSAA